MKEKRIALSVLAYTVGTFSLAVGWHVLLFEKIYHSFGYFEGEPSFLLGLLAIVIQGTVLSILYPLVRLTGAGIQRGLKYTLLTGVFFWTSHVLAFIAKRSVDGVVLFAVMESIYLVLQFGLFGALLGIIYRSEAYGRNDGDAA